MGRKETQEEIKMSGLATQNEKKWVQDMLAKSQNKDNDAKPQSKNDVNINEVEQLTKSIQKRIQEGKR